MTNQLDNSDMKMTV